MADAWRRSALSSLMHSLAASWVLRGGAPPPHPAPLQGLSIRFSSPHMNDGHAASPESLNEEWAMVTGTHPRAATPQGVAPHPDTAPGLLEHRVFAVALQSSMGAAFRNKAALDTGGGDETAQRANKAPGPTLRVTDVAEDTGGSYAPMPHMAACPATPEQPWSLGWRVAAEMLGLPAKPAAPSPPRDTEALPVYRVPGLMVEQLLQGQRVEYVPLFLSLVEARQAWILLQPYCAQLARSHRAARRRKRLGAVLFSIARAAGCRRLCVHSLPANTSILHVPFQLCVHAIWAA